MVLPRPACSTNILFRRGIRAPRSPIKRGQLTRTHKRTYASENGKIHATHKASSDLPWAITSLVIFLPSLWYLAQPQLNKQKHGGGHGHNDHESQEEGEHGSTAQGEGDEKSEEPESDQQGEEKAEGSEAESQGDDNEGKDGDSGQGGDDSGAEDSSQDSNDGGENTPDTSADEGSDDGSGKSKMRQMGEQVRFKGPTKATEKGEQEHEVVKYPDAKGGNKRRLQSQYGIKLGEASEEDQGGDGKDHGASSKPPGDMSTMSGKQEGIANTDTKHSTDITKDPDKSKKAGGMPETAKQKGTVPLDRPLR